MERLLALACVLAYFSVLKKIFRISSGAKIFSLLCDNIDIYIILYEFKIAFALQSNGVATGLCFLEKPLDFENTFL